MNDLFRLDGKVAVVVGGGGGIGEALGHGLVAYGAKVVIADIDLERAEHVAADITSKTSSDTVAFKVDVADEQSVAKLVELVLSQFGTVDILVNAQGFYVNRPATEFPVADWKHIFNVNVTGTMLTCREFGKVMIDRGKGKIINLSSIRGTRSTPWGGNEGYNATKAAVDMITRSLACEWASNNINVNAIAPSHIMTGPRMAPSLQNPERLQRILLNTPLGRIGQPQDIVGVGVFLASSASDYMTGQVLYVDGGMSVLAC